MRDRNRHDNLRRLCDAGLRLFLAEGTAAVSIDDIVGAAAMAKGSFYRYVSDKAELVAHIITPVADEVVRAMDRCEDALRTARGESVIDSIYLRLALELAQIVAAQPTTILLYLQEVRAPRGGARASIHALADQLTARTIRLTEVARDHGLIRDVDARVAALTVIGAIDGILFATLRGRSDRGQPDATAIVTELVRIVLHGIRR
ncbi:MAG: TetR/AcrR family transcriptional regulator [Deltaproteobacteria bacterium]|nr:TetR/AcrR family transcriptional regulator [Deltaproteobacteria bacterium]MCW5802888.1 TetR/AcrR family transcriptional regulator [Deltaproteobacteria bacterium]